jgi:hypothetical protein
MSPERKDELHELLARLQNEPDYELTRSEMDAKIDLRAQTNEWLGWLRDPHILAAMQAKTIDAQPVEGVLPPKQEALPPPEPAQQPRYQGTPAKPEYSRHPRARLAPQSPHINADYDMPSEKRSGFDSAIPYGKKSDGV